MPRRAALRWARRACMAGACAASMGFAGVLWWSLIPPETLARASTAAALGLLGLFVLPAAAIAAAMLERRRRRG